MLMTFLNAFAAFSNAKESSALTNEDLHHAPQGGNQILLTTIGLSSDSGPSSYSP